MNELFLSRMKELLKDEFDAYQETLQHKPYRGFRINTLKITEEEFFQWFQLPSHPSRFAKYAYVLDTEAHFGQSLPHALGLMYMQEPSATSAVSVLDPQPNDWVLDLCAAPGGKSTQIAQMLSKDGFLVSNEIETKRAQVLLSNIERLGISNAVVTNSTPEKITNLLKGRMDKVLVDAPCSGEGMFKKESKAIDDWSEEHVMSCASRQQHILECAIEALKQGGILVYSTCTYAIEENEKNVVWLLEKHPEMELMDIQVDWGRPGIQIEGYPTHYTRRVLPMDEGEGHFVAKFRRTSPNAMAKLDYLTSDKLLHCVEDFISQELSIQPHILLKNNRVYAGNHPFYDFKDNYVLRNQVLMGEVIKNRFEPHQHLYTSVLYASSIKNVCECNQEEVESYRKGNILQKSVSKGFVGIKIMNQFIGFGKSDGSLIKNKIPKGLRIR